MSEKVKSPFLTIFEKGGKHWVDTGHADVGPFDSRNEAKDHIWRILDDQKKRESEPIGADDKLKAFVKEINSDFFIRFLNANVPDTSYSLVQRTHHHHFVEVENPYPEEGVMLFGCVCGVRTYYIEDDEGTE